MKLILALTTRLKRERNPGLIRKAMLAIWPRIGQYSYNPERHYMRGPGPKTLAKIGEMFRAGTASSTQEPLPQRWLELLHSLKEQRDASENVPQKPHGTER